MRRFGVAILASSVLLFSPAGHAQFSDGMACAQVKAAVQGQVAQGKQVADIVKAAMGAHVEAGCLTSALILAGIDPSAAIRAVIAAGGAPAAVVNAALEARVPQSVVSRAAQAAGVSPTVVAQLIADYMNRTRLVGTPGPAAPASLGGGGTASAR